MPKPAITFEVLRHVAEAASGFRYQDTWFVVGTGADGDPVITPHTTAQPETPDTVVFHVEKVGYGPPPEVTRAVLGCGTVEVDLLRVEVQPAGVHPAGTYRADAAFWSVSAVEKFMTPYYASVFGDQGGVIVQALLDVLRPYQPAPEGEEDADGDPAFAVAHLPSSEYVAEEAYGGPTVARMFALRRSGAVEPVRFAPRAG